MSADDDMRPSSRSPLGGAFRAGNAAPSGPNGAGVRASEVRDRVRVWIAPYRQRVEVVEKRLKERFEISLPPLRRFVVHNDLTLLWADAEGWWAEAPVRTPRALGQELSLLFGSAAAVVDQSGAHVFLRLTGPHARNVLSKGCPIDLHPDVFPAGSCAPTLMAHCRVHLRVEADAAFGLLVPSSYALSFCEWLAEAAVEFGPVTTDD